MPKMSLFACLLMALIGCIQAQFSPVAPFKKAQRGLSQRLSCTLDSSTPLASNAVYWYRQKPVSALGLVLYFGAGADTATKEPEFSRFTGGKKGQTLSLTITSWNDGDLATYYCAVMKGGYELVFSSGTKLYFSDKKTQPQIIAYPIAKADASGKSTLICHARDIILDQDKISWNLEKQDGTKVELPNEEHEQLEQLDRSKQSLISMLIATKQNAKTYKYTCSVQHEGKSKSAIIPKDEEKPKMTPKPILGKTCPSPKDKDDGNFEIEEKQIVEGFTKLNPGLYLFSVTYLTLLVKNVLYFATICVLLFKMRSNNKGE